MPVPWCVHSPVDAQLHCFQVLAGIKKAAINICVQVFVWSHAFISLGQYMGGEWVTQWVLLSLSVQLLNCFLSNLPISYYHQQCVRVVIVPLPTHGKSVFLTADTVIGIYWYLIMVLFAFPY